MCTNANNAHNLYWLSKCLLVFTQHLDTELKKVAKNLVLFVHPAKYLDVRNATHALKADAAIL